MMAARSWAGRPGVKQWLLAGALALFIVLATVAFLNLPEGIELDPKFVVLLAVVGAPATLLLNALEYRAIARAAGFSVSLVNAFHVSLTATVANLLPAPGGIAVRTAALKLEGSTLRRAVAVNATAGIIWIGATVLLVGLALLTDPSFTVRGLVVVAVGLAILLATAEALRRQLSGGWGRSFAQLLAIESATSILAAARLAVAFLVIGQSVSLAAALTIASAQVLAAAIGIFPAGLGIREALSAGLALTVQVGAALAITASAVDRLCVLAGMALLLPLLWLRMRRDSRRPGVDGDDAESAAAE